MNMISKFYRLVVLTTFAALASLALAACGSQSTPPTTATLPANTAAPRSTNPPPTTTLSPTPTPLPSATRTRRPTSTMVPTSTPLPSFTPAPTATASPIPTDVPPLAEGSPYLVYYGESDGDPAVILLNENGSGRREIALPAGSRVPDLPDALSPDGQWLALYTGTAGDPQQPANVIGPFDLSLSLMHLPDGEVTAVTGLLGDDYPNDLGVVAQRMNTQQPAAGLSQALWFNEIWARFHAGVTQAQWSPDGQTLAFAAQLDGPSLDLYLYTPVTGALTRAAGGDAQLQWMFWSPDGQYLLHARANRDCTGCETRYALNVGTGAIQALTGLAPSGARVALFDWNGPHQLVFYTVYPSGGQGALRAIDVASGAVTDIFPGRFAATAVDAQLPLYAVYRDADPSTTPKVEAGVYLLHSDTGQSTLVAPNSTYGRLRPVYWGNAIYHFLLQGEDKVYGLTQDGQVALLANGRYAGVSRNGQWVVMTGSAAGTAVISTPAVSTTAVSPPVVNTPVVGPSSLRLVDNLGQVALQVSDEFAGDLFWNTTSTGLFSVRNNVLYYLDLATGSWLRLDSDLPDPTWGGPARIRYGWKR